MGTKKVIYFNERKNIDRLNLCDILLFIYKTS